jgi:hypothetical protein
MTTLTHPIDSRARLMFGSWLVLYTFCALGLAFALNGCDWFADVAHASAIDSERGYAAPAVNERATK